MTTTTLTLSAFLLARIEEDEATARAAIPSGKWRIQSIDGSLAVANAITRHSLRWEPVRVLVECEAKRRIVELHYSWNLQAERTPDPPFAPILETQANTAYAILRALALPYADHPDYDESWRP